jgi:hypothetical protein
MSDRDMDELARWIAAEQEAPWDEADALFAAVASRYLPVTDAPPGLSARIMAAIPRRAATPWTRASEELAASRWARATLIAALVVLGIALSAVSASQFFDVAAASVETLARIAHGLSTSLSAAVGVFVASWTLLNSLGRAATVVTTTGAAPVVIAANLLLACLAFAGLSRLLAPREECS